MKRWLGTADFTVMPWANGLGQTTEMARADEGGRMIWRLSRATVSQDGPFSVFAGIERSLTVLTGPGFDLVGRDIALKAAPMVPVAFPGDVTVSALNVVAPCTDFNVMTARHMPRPLVRVMDGAQSLGPIRLRAVYWPKLDQLLLTDEAHDLDEPEPVLVIDLAT